MSLPPSRCFHALLLMSAASIALAGPPNGRDIGAVSSSQMINPRGACCTPKGICLEDIRRFDCTNLLLGQYLGQNTACPEDGCPDCDCNGQVDIVAINVCKDSCIAAGGSPDSCNIACDENGDGVPNECQDGSNDPDGDGIIADCDGCPLDPDKSEPGICGCGTPETDTDNDGLPDCNDPCPNDANNDIDDDGVCGDEDNCPFNANPDQLDSDGDGRGDLCQDCEFDEDCDDQSVCTEDTCTDGACVHTKKIECPLFHFCDHNTGTCEPGCLTAEDCIDDNLCTFEETCELQRCKSKIVPCPVGQDCNPETGLCGGCEVDEDCNDDVFCNGVEICTAGECGPGDLPCVDPDRPFCDEDNDECDECVVETDCDDDQLCTTDACVDGDCQFDPVECPMGTGCDPNSGECGFCVTVPPGMCCDSDDGVLTPIDDENSCTADICNSDGSVSHEPLALPPMADGIAPRAIEITPQPSDSLHPVALLLTAPPFPCLLKYVDVDGSLVDKPVFQTPLEWGTVVVTDQEIIPSSNDNPTVYEVRAVCDPIDQDTTAPDEAVPYVWGDVNDDTIVDQFDIFCVVDGFQNIFVNCPFEPINLAQCIPDSIIDIFDILAVLDAFVGEPYPCAAPCEGGACCDVASTLCRQLPEAECNDRGWNYQGDGVHCRINPCPFPQNR